MNADVALPDRVRCSSAKAIIEANCGAITRPMTNITTHSHTPGPATMTNTTDVATSRPSAPASIGAGWTRRDSGIANSRPQTKPVQKIAVTPVAVPAPP